MSKVLLLGLYNIYKIKEDARQGINWNDLLINQRKTYTKEMYKIAKSVIKLTDISNTSWWK